MNHENPDDLIRQINPSMSAKQAIENVKLYRQMRPSSPGANQARIKLLGHYGYNPRDWTFFENTGVEDPEKGMSEEELNGYSKMFPSEVEFLALRGAFTGGQFGLSAAKDSGTNNLYSVFIRERPKQLP